VKKIIVAIDGFSSCGKSTLARALSRKLHYAYVDTGAMYRAVTLYCIENQVDISNPVAVLDALQHIEIHFERDKEKGNQTFLNGENVEVKIRQMYVSEHVSDVATISEIRRVMVKQQQAMGNRKGIVMDGRDIGTVVFPKAELKIFLTADNQIRTQRRYDELLAKGAPSEFEDIRHNLSERDRIDSTRADSPLRQADDAIVINNTMLTEVEQLELALSMALKSIEKHNAG
jgi:CMP/dCMP kinase